jgi:MYXO-CTERM domain-containing protein
MDDPLLPRLAVNGDPGVFLALLLFVVAVAWLRQRRR